MSQQSLNLLEKLVLDVCVFRQECSFCAVGPGGDDPALERLREALRKEKINPKDGWVVERLVGIDWGAEALPLAVVEGCVLAVAWLCRAKKELAGGKRHKALVKMRGFIKGSDVLETLRHLGRLEGFGLSKRGKEALLLNTAYCLGLLLNPPIHIERKGVAEMVLDWWTRRYKDDKSAGRTMEECPIRNLLKQLVQKREMQEALFSVLRDESLLERVLSACERSVRSGARMEGLVATGVASLSWKIAKAILLVRPRFLQVAAETNFFERLFAALFQALKGSAFHRADWSNRKGFLQVAYEVVSFTASQRGGLVLMAQILGGVFGMLAFVNSRWRGEGNVLTEHIASLFFNHLVYPEMGRAGARWLEEGDRGAMEAHFEFWMVIGRGELPVQCCSTKCDRDLLAGDVKRCSGCKTAKYCSRACQMDDWKEFHRSECRALKKARSLPLFPRDTLFGRIALCVERLGSFLRFPPGESHQKLIHTSLVGPAPQTRPLAQSQYPTDPRAVSFLERARESAYAAEKVSFGLGAHKYKAALLLKHDGENWKVKKWAVDPTPEPQLV